MEEYQYNFTTREQSKKLMDIGVPADSADCYYNKYINMPYVFNKCVTFSKYAKVEDIIPCWSAGRLIEIIRECSTDYDVCHTLVETLVIPTTDNMDVLVELIYYAKNELNDLDFSKLEDKK